MDDIERRKRNAEYQKQYRKRKAAENNKNVANQVNEHKRARKNWNNKAYRDRKKEEQQAGTSLRSTDNVHSQHVERYEEHPASTAFPTANDDSQPNMLVAGTTSERVAEMSGEPHNHSQPPPVRNPQPLTRYDYTQWIREKRDNSLYRMWKSASDRFDDMFFGIRFDASCSVCDRLWPDTSLRVVTRECYDILRESFPGEDVVKFQVCTNCSQTLRKGKIPNMSRSNGFKYPPRPTHLPPLDPVGLRLISPRLPFMQIRRLRIEGGYGIVGQIVNVPVDVDEMVSCLPRQLNDDYAINVNIKKCLFHKSTYLSGFVNKGAIRLWLQYLVQQPLYKYYNITTDLTELDNLVQDNNTDSIEAVDVNAVPDSEIISARQKTFMWDEEKCLTIAPGQRKRPTNVVFDRHAEELSFPQIYYGVDRKFKISPEPTPYTIATSEIRRKDRRGVTPEHILYMAAKIMRLRVSDGMKHTFKCIPENENITRADLENKEFMKERIEKNLSFLKSIPNSVQYWAERKRDLFAMIRQLGKPTAFMTLSANEVKWPHLIQILHTLNHYHKDVDPSCLTRSMRSTLVNEDPVTCCIYFKKLLDVLVNMLKAKKSYNPFGKYRVLDYFVRIEFQHRGSPHAHILLWLDNDPKEPVSDDMPKTLEMMTDLCSVSKADLVGFCDEDMVYANHVHKHTFTCTKRGETSCRFNIPHWPLPVSRVLLPLPQDYPGRDSLRRQAKQVRVNLETKSYDDILSFFQDNGMNLDLYIDYIRATITRPTVIFERDMTQIMTNTFNPFISSVLNSNMDLQIILDEYSCAAYVVEYVNKSNRGISHLHRELLALQEENPEITNDALMRQIAVKMLNAVEMSAQEAAWYLLRQPMSYGSRDVFYVPTVWPWERQKARKRMDQMDDEGVDEQSTDVWTKGPVQRYEERPTSMNDLCLADFLAWYTPANSRSYKRRVDTDGDLEAAEAADNDAGQQREPKIQKYSKRKQSRVLRSRSYGIEDIVNYKREFVLLYVPFRNEAVDILDRNKFLEIYEQNEALIMEKRKEYEMNVNIGQLMQELQALCVNADVHRTDEGDQGPAATKQHEENNDDIMEVSMGGNISVVRRREGVMPKEEFCKCMRTTNAGQRAFLLEIIHRLHTANAEPIQIFFTGPAGSGKTYVLKLAMEIYNRYTHKHNSLRNAYVACASTGKAAAAFDGTTVHSAFRISVMRTLEKPLANELEQTYRGMFNGVKCVIIDEVSMLSTDVFHKVDARLKQITGVYEKNFGGLDVIFCGDLRQLPPVRATPIFKCTKSMLGGPILWQSLHSYMVTQVMRQSDVTFSSILTKIGSGIPLDYEENKIIESRFRTKEWCDENVKDAVRLFHDNRSVDEYNVRAISNPDLVSVANDLYTGYRDNAELTDARTKLHKMSVSECLGYPYSVQLAVGYPYMVTTNVDVEDGLVNGAIGILKYIERLTEDEIADMADEEGPSSAATTKVSIRLWMKFPSKRVGCRLRMKFKPHVICKQSVLQSDWTPIIQSSMRISLGRNGAIKCRRMHFPIVPACAITIHKSQGASFNTVVYQYNMKQEQQLVYVAMSRATSLKGLYIATADGNFTFYHGRGNSSPNTRDIRDEYTRLARHPLSTITHEALRFMDRDEYQEEEVESDVIILNTVGFNTQSLLAHKEDVETDAVLRRAEYLLLNETWMDEHNAVALNGFDLVHVEKSEEGRTAGGCAIYRSVDSLTTCEPILRLPEIETLYRVRAGVGDICLAGVNLNGVRLCVLGSIYIHPNVKMSEMELLFYASLARYGKSILNIIDDLEVELDVPIALIGDFNIDMAKDKNNVAGFLAREFQLIHHPNALPTTLGGACIDNVFLRHMNTECMPYVSYFSYHRPLLNKLAVLENVKIK